MAQNIVRNIVFEPEDYRILKEVIKKQALGQRGRSAAVRMIIREWYEMRKQQAAAEAQATK